MLVRTLSRGTLAAAIGAALVLATPAAAHADDVSIPFTTQKLDNGMTVILHEDHALPLVVVNVSYGVGSRFEAPKRTGFAHLFEHLMFMGTRRAPTKMFDAWMEASGGWNNAWTSEDRTDYYDVAPKTAMPLLLWLEADRLRDLGPLMTQEKLDAQRAVVENERRQTSENTPYGKAELRLPELLYPEGHPYHHPVIGSHEDLRAATVADVQGFFATYYDPANASLVVAGDFDRAAVLAQIRAEFGRIPSRGAPKDPGAPGFPTDHTTLTSVVRETIEDDVELPKLIFAWQTPKHFGPGDAELDLLSVALANGKASRLYKALVYDRKLAQSVDAAQESGTIGSRFTVEVMARPGVSLDELEKATLAELAKIRDEKLADDELTRAKNVIETGFVERLESVRERASLLNMYQAEVHDPGYAAKDLARYRNATADGIRAVAASWIDLGKMVALRVVPKEKLKPDAQGAKPAHAPTKAPATKGGAK